MIWGHEGAWKDWAPLTARDYSVCGSRVAVAYDDGAYEGTVGVLSNDRSPPNYFGVKFDDGEFESFGRAELSTRATPAGEGAWPWEDPGEAPAEPETP